MHLGVGRRLLSQWYRILIEFPRQTLDLASLLEFLSLTSLCIKCVSSRSKMPYIFESMRFPTQAAVCTSLTARSSAFTRPNPSLP